MEKYEKIISKELRKYEKIISKDSLVSLIQFCEKNSNLTLNFNAYKKNSGYDDNHWYGVSEGKRNLRGLKLEDFEISKEYPIKMIRITDFKNRRYNLPILYMHDSKVINQIELESIQKDLEGLLIDIQLLCSMANSLTALHEKLFITGRDKFIQEFKINQDESEIISHCLWHPEAILIRRITDNDKNQSTSLITIGLKLEKYGFFNNTFLVRDDINKLQKDKNIIKICTYADRCIAHNDKRGCEEIGYKILKPAAKIIVEITKRYLSFVSNVSYGWQIRD